jgi:hypothetical protein
MTADDTDVANVEYPSTLTEGRPIVVAWEGWWTNGVVREGEQIVGTLPDEASFLRGGTFV